MDNFVLFELVTDPFLDFCNHIVQVSVGNCAASTGANLNHKDGVDLSVMLLIRILIPVITFHLPFIGGSLQNSKLIVLFRILRIGNDNTILQQTGCAYFRRGYLTSVQGGSGSGYQLVESISRRTDANNNRHGRHCLLDSVFYTFITLQKTLHDGRCLTCLFALHSSVSFIYDEIQSIRFLLDSVRQSLPYGVLPGVRMMHQIRSLAQFLCVQEVDIAVFQHFHIKGFVLDGNALLKTNLIGL